MSLALAGVPYHWYLLGRPIIHIDPLDILLTETPLVVKTVSGGYLESVSHWPRIKFMGKSALRTALAHRSFRIQGEKAVELVTVSRPTSLSWIDGSGLIRICREWSNAITVRSRLSLGCSCRSVAKG